MKLQLVVLLLMVETGSLSILKAEEPVMSASRATYNFNPGWKLLVGDSKGAATPTFDDAEWKPVTLPHAWNEDSAFKVAIADLPTGIAWYRKHFKLPAGSGGKKVFLEFEGVRQSGEFYLNGKHIGRHENGVMAVGFDVTDVVLPAPQENVLAVRTDNAWDYREQETKQRYQWNDHNFNANYGGIPKNVKLHITDRLYQTLPLYSQLGTEGVYIYAQDFNQSKRAATITAQSQVRNDSSEPRTFSYEVVLEELDGRIIKKFSGPKTKLAAGQTIIVSASARVEHRVFRVLAVFHQLDPQIQRHVGHRRNLVAGRAAGL